MSSSYDNKVLTGSQLERRMHGDPQMFQTLSKRVYGDSVVGELFGLTVHGASSMSRVFTGYEAAEARASFPRLSKLYFLEIYVPKECVSTFLESLCHSARRYLLAPQMQTERPCLLESRGNLIGSVLRHLRSDRGSISIS
jgi:hypothetical protein